MMNSTQQKTPTSSLAEWYWDFTNVHANTKVAETLTRTYDNGLWAWISFGVFLLLTIVAALATWYYDIESTYYGLQAFAVPLVKSLPVAIAGFSSLIVALVTITPMFLEIFASPYAKANIKVIKLMVFGFTIFDVVTDIPRAKQSIDLVAANGAFDSLPTIIYGPVYWILFGAWLLLATVGFQLVTVIFAYTTLVWLSKATGTDGDVSLAAIKKQNAAKQAMNNLKAQAAAAKAKQATKVDVKADDVVEVVTIE